MPANTSEHKVRTGEDSMANTRAELFQQLYNTRQKMAKLEKETKEAFEHVIKIWDETYSECMSQLNVRPSSTVAAAQQIVEESDPGMHWLLARYCSDNIDYAIPTAGKHVLGSTAVFDDFDDTLFLYPDEDKIEFYMKWTEYGPYGYVGEESIYSCLPTDLFKMEDEQIRKMAHDYATTTCVKAMEIENEQRRQEENNAAAANQQEYELYLKLHAKYGDQA